MLDESASPASRPGDEPAPAGALTHLLEQLARASPSDVGRYWERPLRPGDVVEDRFEMLRELGRGGFGVVFEALDRRLGRHVAFKSLRPERRTAALSEAARREAEATASLDHAGIVTLFEAGTSREGPYLVMELLHGETLARRLARGPLELRAALDVAIDVTRALVHAHGRGVLHRDLKPANVFLCRGGCVKLLDLGLAELLGRPGEALPGGTPAYVAPEQWRGEAADGRADVFSAGAMLFEMLEGRTPYPAERGPSAEGDRRPPPVLRVKVPRALARLVGACLEPRPSLRPNGAEALLQRLLEIRGRLDAPRARRRAAFLAAMGAAAGIAATVLWRSRSGGADMVTVAVADFTNEARDPELDGLSGLLAASLAQSPRLQVLTRARMVDVLRGPGRAAPERIDEPLGREVGRRTGAGVLILASVRRGDDDAYAVELRALDPGRGEDRFVLRERAARKEDVLGLVDRLAERTRRALREGARDIAGARSPVAELTTHSLEAYRHYFAGQQHWAAYRTDDAVREYRLAIAADPGFALAHAQLSYVTAEHGGSHEEVLASARAARAGAARLPPADRAFALGWAAAVEGRTDEALRLFDETAALRPDKDALYAAGELLYHRDGPGDAAAALGYYARALELDPSFFSVLDGMVTVLGTLGRSDELRGRVERWSGLPASVPVLTAISRAHGFLGDGDAAIEAARRATALAGGEAAVTALVDALLYAGHYREAEALLRENAAPSQPRAARRWALFQLAAALAYQGRRAEALATLDAVVPSVEGGVDLPSVHQFKAEHLTGDGRAPPVWREVQRLRALGWSASWQSLDLAYVGDLVHAAELAQNLPAGSVRAEYHRAVAAWRSGQGAEALRLLRAMPAERRGLLAFLRGAVAESMGDDAEAIASLQEFQAIYARTRMWRSWSLPQSRVLLARALERSGEHARAAAQLARLLRDWERADPGQPLLAEARAACVRLACRTRAR